MDRVDDLTGVTAHNHSMQEADIMGAASEGVIMDMDTAGMHMTVVWSLQRSFSSFMMYRAGQNNIPRLGQFFRQKW